MRAAGRPRSGDMDCRVTFEYPVTTPDAIYGTPVVTWAVFDTVWAEVQDALPSRSESVTMGLPVARNQTRIRRRWREGVTSAMRVTVHRATDVVMQIIGGPAEIGGRQAFLEVVCERYSS